MNKLNLLIGLIGIVLLSSCGSKPYKVERSAEINTPASAIYNQIVSHKNRDNWSPWATKDPNMTKEYEGPEAGVGSIYKWSSENEEVGTGSMEVVEVEENEYMKSKLTFTAPWESASTVEWNLEEENGVTKATWSNSGELPAMMAMFMDLDEQLGPDFEKGLENLKKLCEETYVAPEPEVVSDSTTMDSSMVEEVAVEDAM